LRLLLSPQLMPQHMTLAVNCCLVLTELMPAPSISQKIRPSITPCEHVPIPTHWHANCHISFSCGASLHTFDKLIKICKEHIESSSLCFHFGSTMRYHSCTTICLNNSSIWVPLSTSIFVPLCIGWISVKFKMFYRGFPSYSGLIWFSCGLGGAIFLKLKG
jgi:hypothetical protein